MADVHEVLAVAATMMSMAATDKYKFQEFSAQFESLLKPCQTAESLIVQKDSKRMPNVYSLLDCSQ